MAGKYAKVIGRLPSLGVDPSRRDAVIALQEQIKAPLDPDDVLTVNVKAVLDQVEKFVRVIVEEKKRQTAGKPYAAEYARAYAECRAIREKMAEWDSAMGLLIEAYQWLMIDQMEIEGSTSLKLASGASIVTFKEPYAKVDDPEAFLAWVQSDPDLRKKLTLPWMTTNKITKDRLLAGDPEPDGISIWAATKVRLGGGEE